MSDPADPQREGIATIAELRRSLHGLAGAGSDQAPLFPDRRVDAGAVAAAFDRAASRLLSDAAAPLSTDAAAAVAAVGRKLTTMSEDGAEFDADLWTESAVRTSEHWAEIRSLATTALDVLDRDRNEG